jgi:hypothetical protein
MVQTPPVYSRQTLKMTVTKAPEWLKLNLKRKMMPSLGKSFEKRLEHLVKLVAGMKRWC